MHICYICYIPILKSSIAKMLMFNYQKCKIFVESCFIKLKSDITNNSAVLCTII